MTAGPPVFGPPTAIIVVGFTAFRADTVLVRVTDPATIAAAQLYVQTHTGPHIIVGPIVRGANPYDPRYPFQFLPDAVRLTNLASSACDGPVMHSAQAVDDFIRAETGSATSPSAVWCAASSYPIRVLVLLGA
jgi:hypothetical protein